MYHIIIERSEDKPRICGIYQTNEAARDKVRLIEGAWKFRWVLYDLDVLEFSQLKFLNRWIAENVL